MYRPFSLRKEIYGGFRSKVVHNKLQKRARSLPPPRRPSLVWEQEHEVERKSQHDCPIRDAVKQVPMDMLHEVPRSRDEDYDSDEEDRRNGVPIIVLERTGCPLNPSLIEKVTHNLDEALEEKDILIKLLSITNRRYVKVCSWFSQAEGYQWNQATKHYAMKLEDRYFQLMEEKHQLDSEISHIRTMLMSFKAHEPPSQFPSLKTKPSGSMSWASSGNYERFQSGEILPLEYEGKDYNFF